MAKSKTQEKADELDQLTSTESFIDKYKNILIFGGGAIVVIVLGVIGYQKLVSEPHEMESREAYWNAFYDFQNDSLTTAINGGADYEGMQDIASEYGGTSGGDIANYSLAVSAMQNGEFDNAISYFDECGFEDVILGSMVIGLKGDCYVELGDYETAVAQFEEAASREENDFTTPMFLMKAGLTYEELGQNDKALAAYERIEKDWPNTDEGRTVEKYIERAKN